jgi:hypothetical protein
MLRLHGAVFPFHHTSSWRGFGFTLLSHSIVEQSASLFLIAVYCKTENMFHVFLEHTLETLWTHPSFNDSYVLPFLHFRKGCYNYDDCFSLNSYILKTSFLKVDMMVGHVECTGQMRNSYKILTGNLKRKDHLRDLFVQVG